MISRRFWPTPTAPGSHQVGKIAEWGGSGNPLRNGESIASAAVSPASPYQLPGSEKVRQMIAGCGPSSNESLAYYDRNLCWWRTYQASFTWMADNSSTVSCPTWPRSGMTRNGTAYRLPTLARRISGTGSGSWPTPAARDWRSPNSMKHIKEKPRHNTQLPNALRKQGITGQLNPLWVEWLMGFPPGWTDLRDSETQ